MNKVEVGDVSDELLKLAQKLGQELTDMHKKDTTFILGVFCRGSQRMQVLGNTMETAEIGALHDYLCDRLVEVEKAVEEVGTAVKH